MKGPIAGILAVALIAEAIVFIVGGVGASAISVGLPNNNVQTASQVQSANGGGAMTFQVHILTAEQGGTIATSMIQGGESTPITFGVSISTNNNCGNGGQPVWNPTMGNPGWYSIELLDASNNPEHVIASLDGTSQQGFYLTTGNISGGNYLYYCEYIAGPGAGNQESTNFGPTATFTHTVTFLGTYPDSKLQIDFHASGPNCGGASNSGQGAVCASTGVAGGIGNCNAINCNAADGTWSIDSFQQVLLRSGTASVSVITPGGKAYNGGTIQVSVWTGYDGPTGYELRLLCPTARSCGGQVDSSFSNNPVSIQSGVTGQIVTWKIPNNAAQNDSNPSTQAFWNTWYVDLVANLWHTNTTPVQIAISPIYSPGTPAVWVNDTSTGALLPSVGDNVQITVLAGESAAGNPVASFQIWVFYLTPGQIPSSPPGCSATIWVTPGCPNPAVIPVSGSSGGMFKATYNFQVSGVLGTVAIGVEAAAITNQGQPSNISVSYKSIEPKGCQIGEGCNPVVHPTNGYWTWLGPVVLAAMIATAAALAFFVLPATFWIRAVIVVGAVGGVALVVFVLSQFFLPGAALGGPA